jgi:hypothetical protein
MGAASDRMDYAHEMKSEPQEQNVLGTIILMTILGVDCWALLKPTSVMMARTKVFRRIHTCIQRKSMLRVENRVFTMRMEISEIKSRAVCRGTADSESA